MWFILYSIAIFYDAIVKPLLAFISGDIIPEITDIFVSIFFGFVFWTSGVEGWAMPLILSSVMEEVPLVNLLPGYSGLVHYVKQNQPAIPATEEKPSDKEEIVAEQSEADRYNTKEDK